MSDTQQFYDGIAANYTGIFKDWHKAVDWQADILSTLLARYEIDAPAHILDCTCGIGTQTIALALKGYRVHGSDLSPKSIEQAKHYAQDFGLVDSLSFSVADLLKQPSNPTEYDAVLAFDNAIAHLHSEQDFLTALETMKMQTQSGGRIFISLRDYDAMALERPHQTDLRIKDTESGRQIMFQVLDWAEDGSGYASEMFIITETDDGWQTTSETTHMTAWRRDDLTRLLKESGLTDIEWLMPEDSAFYQPIVTAIHKH